MMCKGCCANPPTYQAFLPQPFHLYQGFKGGVGKVMEWQSNGQQPTHEIHV